MPKSRFDYNFEWMDRTFSSQLETQSLLTPQRENGNITPHDYDLATTFLPGPHRHYRKAGAIVGAGIPMAFNRSWTNPRSFITITTCGLLGALCGHYALILSHLSFLRSIENLHGFSQAMANIRMNMDGIMPVSPSTAQGDDSWVSSDEAGVRNDSPSNSPVPSPNSASPTRWDQIRSANSRKSSSSSWDIIRQNHERTRILHSKSNLEDANEKHDDRAAEQARFDAMLEKERNMSKQ